MSREASKTADGRGGRLILVRHTQVAAHLSGICYGASDVALSAEGEAHANALAVSLAREGPAVVLHSGLSRARYLAEQIARHAGVELLCDARLLEMNFGAWELRSWDDIFLEVGHGMSRLVHEPDSYCAPGGETANDVRDRMISWVSQLPADKNIVAVGHGGAICTLRGTLAGAPSSKWPDFMPTFGEIVHIRLPI